MARPPNLVISPGMQFSRLTVIREAGRDSRQYVMWECRCECGAITTVNSGHLRSGNTKSCGCLSRDTTTARNIRHGMTGTRVYRIWEHIHKRCSNPNHEDYENYGGRGIKVCDRWKSFENFYADMGVPPTDTHSIDRRDANGDYSLENCRWATSVEQANNRRSTPYLELNGVRKSRMDWSRELGISPGTIKARQRLGWTDEMILTTPPDTRRGAHMRKS